MIQTTEKVKDKIVAEFVRYRDVSDFAKCIRTGKYAATHGRRVSSEWAGGSADDFQLGCTRGDVAYGKRAGKLVDEFTNVTLKDYDRTLEWNNVSGVLDYGAAMSGDPMCMYGMTIDLVDTAPVVVYVDMWISATIKTAEIERRGVAVLALVQALSVFRPVQLKIVCGTGYTPTNKNVIQVVPVPTSPMDMARASWMIASPLVARHGLHSLIFETVKNDRECYLPAMDSGRLLTWQKANLGRWLADKEGIVDMVSLPLMMHSDSNWKNEATALAWVKRKLGELMPQNDA